MSRCRTGMPSTQIVHIAPALPGYHGLEALKWLLTYKESRCLLERWRLRFIEFDFETQYRKGAKH